MKTPAEHFGLKVIGYATSPAYGPFPETTYEVLEVVDMGTAGRSFMVNKWYLPNNRVPLWVTEQFGAKFKKLSEVK